MYPVSLEWVLIFMAATSVLHGHGMKGQKWDRQCILLNITRNTIFPPPHYLFSIVGNPALANRTATVKPNR